MPNWNDRVRTFFAETKNESLLEMLGKLLMLNVQQQMYIMENMRANDIQHWEDLFDHYVEQADYMNAFPKEYSISEREEYIKTMMNELNKEVGRAQACLLRGEPIVGGRYFQEADKCMKQLKGELARVQQERNALGDHDHTINTPLDRA